MSYQGVTQKGDGLLKLSQIIGDAKKGISPIIPVSRSTWYKGISEGRFPKGVRVAKRLILWRAKDIDNIINSDPVAASNDDVSA